jgi:DNA-binding HxlR family transcriptional regulator
LTERLKRLQNEGLIEHQKQEKILVKNGAYQITAKGQDLEKIISAIEQYGNKYFNHIVD